jgi:hypothetical protein
MSARLVGARRVAIVRPMMTRGAEREPSKSQPPGRFCAFRDVGVDIAK